MMTDLIACRLWKLPGLLAINTTIKWSAEQDHLGQSNAVLWSGIMYVRKFKEAFGVQATCTAEK